MGVWRAVEGEVVKRADDMFEVEYEGGFKKLVRWRRMRSRYAEERRSVKDA